ncbi:MAG: TolB family protein [Planctomycetota bacterium]|jgi:hypothetical protein
MTKHWKKMLALLVTALAVGLFSSGLSMAGKGGGGKKPPPPPPPPAAPGTIYWGHYIQYVGQEIWRMDPDGGNKARILPPLETFGVQNMLSGFAEPSSLLYENERWWLRTLSFDGVYEVYAFQPVTLPDGSTGVDLVQLTALDPVVRGPIRWSNDGQDSYIAISGGIDGTGYIWRLNISALEIDMLGSAIEPVTTLDDPRLDILLTVPGSNPGHFALSPPDQNQVVYGNDGDVYVVDIADGSHTMVFNGWPGGPDWSPDGSTIAFSHGDGTFYNYRSIWTIDVESGAATELVAGPVQRKRKRVGWYTVDFHHPRFSPDGFHIAFTEYRYLPSGVKEKGINRISVDGGTVYDLTDDIVDPTLVGLAGAWR